MAPEIRLTAGWVAAAMAGTIVAGDAGREFAGVSIDALESYVRENLGRLTV